MRATALILALFFAVSPPVFACSSHGEAAATNVNAWMGDNGLNGLGFTVTGSQAAYEGNDAGGDGSTSGGTSGWAANDLYWVTVTAPNGETITFEAVPTSGGLLGNGEDLENWLEAAAETWLLDHIPDQKLADFVG